MYASLPEPMLASASALFRLKAQDPGGIVFVARVFLQASVDLRRHGPHPRRMEESTGVRCLLEACGFTPLRQAASS